MLIFHLPFPLHAIGCTSETGENSECLLLPDYVSEEGKIGVMLPTSVYGPTHVIELRGEELVVRLMVVVVLENRNEVTIDPFDFIYEKGTLYNIFYLFLELLIFIGLFL